MGRTQELESQAAALRMSAPALEAGEAPVQRRVSERGRFLVGARDPAFRYLDDQPFV